MRARHAPQSTCFENVGLINHRQLLPTLHRCFACQSNDALDFMRRVHLSTKSSFASVRKFFGARWTKINSPRELAEEEDIGPFNDLATNNGDESNNSGKVVIGRRLANNPISLRMRSKPASGRVLALGSSHFGPPTAPSKTASLARQAFSVCFGQGIAKLIDGIATNWMLFKMKTMSV